MRIDYETQEYIQGCIKTCEGKHHLQQVAFSTFHNCLTQVCFTCNVCRTSLPELEQTKIKKNQSLKSFDSSGSANSKEEYSIRDFMLGKELPDTKNYKELKELEKENEVCECGHTKEWHFGMTEEGSFCHYKNENGNYDCDCTKFRPKKTEVKDDSNEPYGVTDDN